ncbi:MAG: NAD-dependent epimerase/dehydratase family protein [Ignavibacteria bacterium]|nr:NAD-dependent epimerase/dehydratase family protein [Ignavibacteria bacterium]
MKILITGGAGFIGSNIADAYVKLGHDVTVLDNLSTGNKRFINKKCRFYKLDLINDDIEKVFRKERFDIVNHHAAQINPKKSIEDPCADAELNIKATLRLLELSVKYKIKKFIFASSGGAVYGEQKDFPAQENHVLNPLSPYGISKLSVEKYLDFYNKYYGLKYVTLRYSNVYGQRQNQKGESGVVSIFCRKILSSDVPLIYGDGKNTRDFIYVKDVALANVAALKFKGTETFNISTCKETSIYEIAGKINTIMKSGSEIKYTKGIKGEQKRSILSYKKASKSLNWKPHYSLDKGLIETCEWFKSNT